MTTVTSAVRDALKAQPYRCHRAVRIQFPGYDFKVWDGSGPKTISGQSYTGAGTLGAISPIADNSVDGVRGPVAERIELTLSGLPLSASLITELKDFQHQGAAVSVLEAHFDAAGALVADPYSIFEGQVDTMHYELGDKGLTITVIAENFLAYMFRGPDGRRRGDSDQQELFSGDVAFAFQGKLTPNIPWGSPTNNQLLDKVASASGSGLPGILGAALRAGL